MCAGPAAVVAARPLIASAAVGAAAPLFVAPSLGGAGFAECEKATSAARPESVLLASISKDREQRVLPSSCLVNRENRCLP